MASVLLESSIPGLTPLRGKVRDVYDFGDRLLFVATDRISAFDWIMPVGIPDKGRILTAVSEFWFQRCPLPHHRLGLDPEVLPLPAGTDVDALRGRSMVVRKTEVVPIECVVRGYLAGSGWKEYQQSGTVCGIELPPDLIQSSRLPEPIFTPATKAETGHDENISFEQMIQTVGEPLAVRLRDLSRNLYSEAAETARERGLILADTKFEFGLLRSDAGADEILLIDEVLTPDSSRYWPADGYEPGRSQPSFDKQFVRDWLESTDWDKNSPPPMLPPEIVARTREKYIEAFELLTETPFPV